MRPTIGRIVHYNDHGVIVAGIITRVWARDARGEGGVNLTLFPDGGGLEVRADVAEGDTPGTWAWPPRV